MASSSAALQAHQLIHGVLDARAMASKSANRMLKYNPDLSLTNTCLYLPIDNLLVARRPTELTFQVFGTTYTCFLATLEVDLERSVAQKGQCASV
jgi:hypothetical protein